MRDYGVISPKFWQAGTGKALRGNTAAQVLALYLMTSPHANMIGVFNCPILYMANETGLSLEGASKALQSLIEADFCTFEADTDTVFVHRMAVFQVGESLAAADNRVKAVNREWKNITSAQLRAKFFAIYSVVFHLVDEARKDSPSGAPSKPLRSQEQEQEQEQDKKPPSSAKGTALPKDWVLPSEWQEWAEHERPDLDVGTVACIFRDYWTAKPGKDGRKLDWQATWRNFVRNQREGRGGRTQPSTGMAFV